MISKDVGKFVDVFGGSLHAFGVIFDPLTPIPPLPHPTDLHNHTNPETAIAYKPLILWGSR